VEKNQNEFDVSLEGIVIKVQRRIVAGNQILFRAIFPDARQPLLLTRASRLDGSRHWTSIPEGRYDEAQAIGPLIEAYFK
jgi:hypothetical protein